MADHDFRGPQTSKANGGLGKGNESKDGIQGMVLAGPAPAGYTHGDIKRLIQISDGEALGFNAAYDANNAVLVYDEIFEYFRLYPDGVLYIMVVPQGTTMTEMCDKTEDYVMKLLTSEDTKREIKCVGVKLNPILYSPVTSVTIDVGGADYQVGDAIVATGGDGADFDAEVATVDGGGAITDITINDNGSGYFSLPALTITTAGGAGATLTAVLGDKYIPVVTDGIDADVLTAIPKAQGILDELRGRDIFVDGIVIEGRSLTVTIANIPIMRELAANGVSVSIAADPYVWGKDKAYAEYAAIGAVLGGISIRKVCENLGSTDIANKPTGKETAETYPLTDADSGRWLSAGLSSGTRFNDLSEADKAALSNKTGGYIFAGKYEGYAGVFFNDSPTCIELADDYAQIEMNRTWNKAVRYLCTSLIPKMKGDFDVDDNGYLPAAVINMWVTKADESLRQMKRDNEVSNYRFTIDPKQNVLGGLPIKGKLAITPRGIAREIENEVGFVNPFSN